jgi:hypothetical protein
MDGWMDGWMMDGWMMDGWIDRQMYKVVCLDAPQVVVEAQLGGGEGVGLQHQQVDPGHVSDRRAQACRRILK